eukprot:SAG22_NODE_3084_length_1955_cov_1.813578_2_plen_79_part_00
MGATAAASAVGSINTAEWKETTCPTAWTSRSVRPAPFITPPLPLPPLAATTASWSASSTDRRPGSHAYDSNELPWYAT